MYNLSNAELIIIFILLISVYLLIGFWDEITYIEVERCVKCNLRG